MKTIKGYVLLKREEQLTREDEMFVKGEKSGAKSSKKRIEELEKALERKEKTAEILDRELNDANIRIEVLEEERDDTREVAKAKIKNDDLTAVLTAKREGLDQREAKLKDREAKLESQEEGRYKVGYADGVSDGVRKISEITQKDRDNAMKIAMVAAASHTPVANIKEINSELRLTTGSEDPEAK